MSNLESILQELHTESDPGTYLETHGSFSVSKNNIVEEEEGGEEIDPEETNEARSTINFK